MCESVCLAPQILKLHRFPSRLPTTIHSKSFCRPNLFVTVASFSGYDRTAVSAKNLPTRGQFLADCPGPAIGKFVNQNSEKCPTVS
jgi:hypothetical protein